MAKKKPPKKTENEASLPKFSGFNALAAGLGDLKSKLDAEEERKKKEAEARKAAGQPPPPPPKPAPAPRRPDLKPNEREDELSFHRMMSGVTPLEGRSRRVTVAGEARVGPSKQTPTEIRERAQKEARDALEQLHHLVDDGVRFEVTDDGKRVEGRRLDVAPSLVRELRRGSLPIDGRLDLHGMPADAAKEHVLEFLSKMRARGERCVLVIHGKGEGRGDMTGGVLRGEIAAWLSQGRAREHVAAFATAHADDGGEGAVYVALRR
jgi:DNA-nicking Smr family endonuclease